MVTIDVNSGSATKEKGIEDTAFRVNMEAVPEIARQLRLRDLGGIVVIDFIDMSLKKHKQEVEKALKAVLRGDRAKTKMLRISGLGLLELSRQRLKSVLGTGEYLECPLCDGQGKIRSPETSALSVYRRIKSLLIRSDVSEVRATVPSKVAEYLLNNMRGLLVDMENQYRSRVTILVKQSLPDKDISVEAVKEEAPEQQAVEALPAPSPAPDVAEASEEEDLADAEPKKLKKPGRRRRRPKKKSPSDSEERPLSLEEEPGPAVASTEDAGGQEFLQAEALPAGIEEAEPVEEQLGQEEPAEPQTSEITEEKTEPVEPAQAQGIESGQSEAPEDAKKETKPRRKSWLQDFLPFS
jgi:ribonuclease E